MFKEEATERQIEDIPVNILFSKGLTCILALALYSDSHEEPTLIFFLFVDIIISLSRISPWCCVHFRK